MVDAEIEIFVTPEMEGKGKESSQGKAKMKIERELLGMEQKLRWGFHSIFRSSAMKILLFRYFLKEESDSGLGNFWPGNTLPLYL